MAEIKNAFKLNLKEKLPEIYNLLFKVERLAIFMVIIFAGFELPCINVFTRTSLFCLEFSPFSQLGIPSIRLYSFFFFWIERAWSAILILSCWSTNFSYIFAVASFVFAICTICKACILNSLPLEGQNIQKNGIPSPNPRETKKREGLEKEEVTTLTKCISELEGRIFLLERLAIMVFILKPRLARLSSILFCFSHFIYLICYAVRLDANATVPKHGCLFWTERAAAMLLELLRVDGTPEALSIASHLFVLTNTCMITQFIRSQRGSGQKKSKQWQQMQQIVNSYSSKVRETSKGEQLQKEEAKIEDHPPKAILEADQRATEEETNKRETNKGEQPEKEIVKIEDEAAKENLKVDQESQNEEDRKWEEVRVEAGGQMEEKIQVEEEEAKEESNNWEEDLVEADENRKEKSEVDLEEIEKEIKKWEEVLTEADEQFEEKSEVESEPAKEENNKWEEELGEADGGWKEKFDQREARKEKDTCADCLWSALGISGTWEDFSIGHDNMNWEEEEWRPADEVSNHGDNSTTKIENDLTARTAENARINNEELVLKGMEEVERLNSDNDNLKAEKEVLANNEEVERLKADNDILKKEKEVLEKTMMSERLMYADILRESKIHTEKYENITAMYVEANLQAEAWVKELENYRISKQAMMARLNAYEEESRKWDQQKKEFAAKLQALAAAAEKDQGIVKNCTENLYQKWEVEKFALTQQLSVANSLCNYYAQVSPHNSDVFLKLDQERNELFAKYCAATESSEHYRACLSDCEEKCDRLMEKNDDLARKLQEEISSASRDHNIVSELEQKCRRLEEDKNNLTAKLCAAMASSELYRSMLHDIGC